MHELRHGLKGMWWLLCSANRKPLVDISVLLGILRSFVFNNEGSFLFGLLAKTGLHLGGGEVSIYEKEGG